jgi:hypothetical protein
MVSSLYLKGITLEEHDIERGIPTDVLRLYGFGHTGTLSQPIQGKSKRTYPLDPEPPDRPHLHYCPHPEIEDLTCALCDQIEATDVISYHQTAKPPPLSSREEKRQQEAARSGKPKRQRLI